MDWLRGSRLGEAKRLVAQLGDPTKRERATQELIRMDADAAPTLVEALQTKDPHLLALYQQILARIPAAGPLLVKTLTTAHPILRVRVAEVFGMSKDRTAVRPLLEALEGRYFTVRARAALALGSIGAREAIPALLTALKDPEGEVRTAACPRRLV